MAIVRSVCASGHFGLAEQMCGRVNKQIPFATSGAEAFG